MSDPLRTPDEGPRPDRAVPPRGDRAVPPRGDRAVPSGGVLEHNVARLFARSWKPVQARASFRSSLERDVAEHVRALAARAGGTFAASRRDGRRGKPLALAWVSLAALLLGVLGWRAWRPKPALDADAITAQGRVAVRELDGPWRAVDVTSGAAAWPAAPELSAWNGAPEAGGAGTASSAVDLGALAARAELATPERTGARARWAPPGFAAVELELGARSRARLAGDFAGNPAGNPAGNLAGHERGSDTARALGATCARVDLEGGALAVSIASPEAPPLGLLLACGEGRVRLEGGRASFQWYQTGAPGSTRRGLRIAVREGRAVVAAVAASSGAGEADAEEAVCSGEVAWLRQGRLEFERRASPELGTPDAVQREPAVAEADPEVSSERGDEGLGDGAIGATSIALHVAVRARADGGELEPVPRYRLFVLKEVQLPQASKPDVIEVDAPDGRAAVPPQGEGRYKLFVDAPGFALWRRAGLDLSGGGGAAVLEVELVRGATLRGAVLDAQTGIGIAGAIVLAEHDVPSGILALDAQTLEGEGVVRSVRTRLDGSFELEHVSTEKALLRATAEGYAASWSDALALADGEARSGIEIALGGPGAVEGWVRDEHGAPRAGLPLIASGTDFTGTHACLSYRAGASDAEGHYRIADLPVGMVAVMLFDSPTIEGAGVPKLQVVELKAGHTARVDFAPGPRTAAISGRVVSQAGAPIALRSVWACPETSPSMENYQSSTTDGDGAFSMAGLEAGRHELFLSGRVPSDLVFLGFVDVPPAGRADLELVAGSGRIRGTVTRAEDGRPAAANVVLIDRAQGAFAGRAMVDTAGLFELVNVPAGQYDVWVYGIEPGRAQTVAEAVDVVRDAAPTVLSFALAPGGSVDVVALDASGAPAARARVRFVDELGRETQFDADSRTRPDGTLRAQGVSVGRWTVRVHMPSGRLVVRAFDVQVGVQTRVVVDEREP